MPVGSLVGVLLLVVGLALVVAGAELFFHGLLATATRPGLSAFVLTVVISGFELENLAAGIAANLKGLGNAAAGTFLGGTTFLALAVAGLSVVIADSHRPAYRRFALGGRGAATTARARTRRRPLPPRRSPPAHLERDRDRRDRLRWPCAARRSAASKTAAPILRMLGGLAILSGAGVALGDGLHRVVTSFGISQSLLGNTAVAATVETEEVSRVAVPTRHGHGDIALGNVFGTIAHFAAFNAGIIALARPIHLDPTSWHLHLPVAGASVLLLVTVAAWRRGLRGSTGQPSSPSTPATSRLQSRSRSDC